MKYFSYKKKNILAGFITGMLYKSTLGYKASLVGGVTGMGIITTI